MSLPDPLTPPDCDLQDFPFMPLHVARLRDSDFAASSHPEACWYGVLLWSAAWHQVPAASLPNNETVLMRLCGLGRDVKTFRKHREDMLRGFVECSDGRLYHVVVAEQANASWAEKLAYRERKAKRSIIGKKAADARWGDAESMPDADAQAMHDASERDASCMLDDAKRIDNAMPKGTGTGTGNIREESFALVAEVATAKPTKPPKAEYPPAFEVAWKAYPHVTGRSSKPKAVEQWRRLSAEHRDGLPAAIERFKPNVGSVCRDAGAPCMARWLRDGKHLDWLAEPAAAVDPQRLGRIVAAWRDGSDWPTKYGPAPDQPDTTVPDEHRGPRHANDHHEPRKAA